MRKTLFAVAALTLLLTACKAEINIAIDVSDEGAVEASAEFGVDEEFQELIGAVDDPGDLIGESGLGIGPDDGEAYTRIEGEFTYFGATKTYDSFEAFEADFAGDDPDNPFSNLSFEMDESGAVLDGVLAPPEEAVDTSEFPIDPAQLTADIFSVNLIFGMPGTVKEHNADRVLSDGRLLWQIPLLGEEKVIHATSGSGSSLWWLWIVLGAVVILGIIAGAVAIAGSRRQSQRAIDEADPDVLA